MNETMNENYFSELGTILESIHPGVTIADFNGIFRFVSDSYTRGRSVKKSDIVGKFCGSEEMKKIFSPCVTYMVMESGKRVSTVQKGIDNDETFVTGIPVFHDGKLAMIISYSSWEVTGFDDLRERVNVLEYQNKKLLKEIELASGAGKKPFITMSRRSKDSRRLAEIFCEAGKPSYIYGPAGSGKSFLASTVYGEKGYVYTYDCSPVSEKVIERELLSEGSIISPLTKLYAVIIKSIDKLSMENQVKLLKKCDFSGIIPIGLSEYSLDELKKRGKICEEFIDRFESFQIRIYPVNERVEDMKEFIDFFLNKANQSFKRNVSFTPRAYGCLLNHKWEENIDEIRRSVERIVLTADKDKVDVFDLPHDFSGDVSEIFSENASLKDMLEFYEKGIIQSAYEKYKTSVGVAENLGISQATAVRKIHKYALGEK